MSDLMRHLTVTAGFKFPVHRLYTKYVSIWERIRDAIDGQEAVKFKAERYLPRLSGQKDTDYRAFKNRAVFFGISGRLLNTNVGVIVRKSPVIVFSDDMKYYFDNDTINVLGFDELRRKLTRELITTSRVATLVDVVQDRPVAKIIPTESIINWVEDENGLVTQILLAVEVITTAPITFIETAAIKYFMLHIDNGGYYAVTEMDDAGKEIVTNNPSIRGAKLTYIPFFCVNPFGVDINPVKPPMLDIVDINYSHYLTSADLENGRHFVGLPTPYVTGATKGVELKIGCESAWIIPSKDAKVGYLEFQGQGLDALAKALNEKQSQMSQFSAQLMDTSTRGSEAEGTVRLRYSSDAANLTDIALSTESCLRLTYNTIAAWQSFEMPMITLNKDFLATKLNHNELNALTKALVDGAITQEIFIYNLERGEMTPPQK